jgi:hypothetical protein
MFEVSSRRHRKCILCSRDHAEHPILPPFFLYPVPNLTRGRPNFTRHVVSTFDQESGCKKYTKRAWGDPWSGIRRNAVLEVQAEGECRNPPEADNRGVSFEWSAYTGITDNSTTYIGPLCFDSTSGSRSGEISAKKATSGVEAISSTSFIWNQAAHIDPPPPKSTGFVTAYP